MQEHILPRRPAAQYLRMSTDAQHQSLPTQREAIAAYAQAHDLHIVRSYVDAGRSGLTFNGRPSMRALLSDVLGGKADFECILVYDVSRWGRFQDSDESAHYEFICRQAGVGLIYVAEPFSSDTSALGTIIKGVKRVMASEFSRDLSRKVLKGHTLLTLKGHRQGGTRPYGYERWAMSQAGGPIRLLPYGENKARRTDYVVLRLGPPSEVEVVKSIFDLVTEEGLRPREIAAWLNERGIPSPGGVKWKRRTVSSVLHNPVYAGHLAWSRTSGLMKTRVRPVDPSKWVVHLNTHPPIISQTQYAKVQGTTFVGSQQPGRKEELLAVLQAIVRKHGRLSSAILSAEPGCPHPSVFGYHFGSLLNAYRQAGYEPPAALRAKAASSQRSKLLHKRLADDVERQLCARGLEVKRNRTDLTIEGYELEFVLLMPNLRRTGGATNYSVLREADFYLAGRVAETLDQVSDFALVDPTKISKRPKTYQRHALPAVFGKHTFRPLAVELDRLAGIILQLGRRREGTFLA